MLVQEVVVTLNSVDAQVAFVQMMPLFVVLVEHTILTLVLAIALDPGVMVMECLIVLFVTLHAVTELKILRLAPVLVMLELLTQELTVLIAL